MRAELVIGWRAIGEADHLLANRAVRHELPDVYADAARFERLALFGEIDGTAAVRIDEYRGDALRKERRRLAKTSRQPLGAVGVHVDESGRNRQPRRVEGVMSEDRRPQETNRERDRREWRCPRASPPHRFHRGPSRRESRCHTVLRCPDRSAPWCPPLAHDAVTPIANSHPQRLRIVAILVWSLDLTEPFWHLRQRLDLSGEPQGCRIAVTRGVFRSFWSCSQR